MTSCKIWAEERFAGQMALWVPLVSYHVVVRSPVLAAGGHISNIGRLHWLT